MNRLLYGPTGYQVLYFSPGAVVRSFDQLADNAVGRSIRPIRSGMTVFVCLQMIHKLNHTPWIINICAAKYISIVPFLKDFILVRKTKILTHLFYLFFRKTKILVIALIQNRCDFQVVHAGKNTFTGNPEAARYHRKFKAAVGLKRSFKKRTDKVHHLPIKTLSKSIFQWNIIFINQYNCFFAVILLQTS